MSENTPETVDNPAVEEDEVDDTDMSAEDVNAAPSAADPDDGEGAVEETDPIEAGESA